MGTLTREERCLVPELHGPALDVLFDEWRIYEARADSGFQRLTRQVVVWRRGKVVATQEFIGPAAILVPIEVVEYQTDQDAEDQYRRSSEHEHRRAVAAQAE